MTIRAGLNVLVWVTILVVAAAGAKAQPAHDNCGSAMPVGVGSTDSSFTGATSDGGLNGCSPGARDVWFRFTAPSSGIARISCSGMRVGAFASCNSEPI